LPYKLSGVDDILAELIQAGGEILCCEIHSILIQFGTKKNCLSSGISPLLYPFKIREKLTAVIIEVYRYYQSNTTYYPISKLLWIISVVFEVTNQLLFIIFHSSDIGENLEYNETVHQALPRLQGSL
jgi:hypothetical protein